jgi:hypothetical protein
VSSVAGYLPKSKDLSKVDEKYLSVGFVTRQRLLETIHIQNSSVCSSEP